LETYGTLVWEVNVWAWFEYEGLWSPAWYPADHDLSILAVPTDHWAVRAAGERQDFGASPTVVDGVTYRAGSVAAALYRSIRVFNTRYVNYTIDSQGLYLFEGDTCLRTQNVMTGVKGGPVVMALPAAFRHLNSQCEGFEDVRLFVDDGVLRFVASCTFEDGHVGMVEGTYDVEQGSMTDVVRLPSPKGAWCEKNWTPLGGGRYIYQWSPLEIWRYQGGAWEKERTNSTDAFPVLKRARGSTPFVPYGADTWIGLVHFSEGACPRHYFHVVVVLDAAWRPVRTSVPMYFDALGIEFCTGCLYQEGELVCWVSRFDREPVVVCVPEDTICWYNV
jgi:hypothetical protein